MPGFEGGYSGTAPIYPVKRLNQRQLTTILELPRGTRTDYFSAISYAERLLSGLEVSGGEPVDPGRYAQIVDQLQALSRKRIIGTPKDTVNIDPLVLRVREQLENARVRTIVQELIFEELTALLVERIARDSGLEFRAEA